MMNQFKLAKELIGGQGWESSYTISQPPFMFIPQAKWSRPESECTALDSETVEIKRT
jgi:hypothetical protein